MGVAIAKGILKTLGIAYKEPEVSKPAASGKLYRVQVGAYSVKANAEAQLAKVKAAGFADAFIV
jgi:N-acetylmuramoyl-L-alanine amidase